MRKFSCLILSTLLLGVAFQACDDSETYADLKKAERKNIRNFIAEHNITEISEEEFIANDSTTDVSNNEFVLFNDNGVYMQIVNKGEGESLKSGEWKEIVVRFWEVYVSSGDTTTVSNMLERYPDIFMAGNTSGSFTGTFTEGNMYSNYGSAVPEAWLLPLSYIKLSKSPNQNKLPKVKLIVPHSAGHSTASSSVEPYYYEITYKFR